MSPDPVPGSPPPGARRANDVTMPNTGFLRTAVDAVAGVLHRATSTPGHDCTAGCRITFGGLALCVFETLRENGQVVVSTADLTTVLGMKDDAEEMAARLRLRAVLSVIEATHDTNAAAAERDRFAARYNPADNDYDLAADPRCLWGWGPGDTKGCDCRFGHACFRAFGHPGKCWDAGESQSKRPNPLLCWQHKRPKDWDTKGRAEANTDA